MASTAGVQNFHDSIRQMFTGSVGATATNSLASTFSSSANSLESLVRSSKEYNLKAMHMMQEQTKLLRQLVKKTDGGGSGGLSWLDLLLLKGKGKGGILKNLPKFILATVADALGISTAVAAAGGMGKSLASGIKVMVSKGMVLVNKAITKNVGAVFSMVAAAGRPILAPLAGLKNVLTSSGVMKLLATATTGLKFLPRVLGKLFLPITALMGIVDSFKGWSNAEAILGKSNVSFWDRVSSAIGSAVNGLLLGIPDWLVGMFGGGNTSTLLASAKDKVVDGIKVMGNGIGTFAYNAASYLFSNIPSVANLLGNAATTVYDKVTSSFDYVTTTIWDSITSLGAMISDGFKNFFADMFKSIKDWFTGGGPASGKPPATRAGSRSWGGGGGGGSTSVGGSDGGSAVTSTPRATNTPASTPSQGSTPYTGARPRQGSSLTGGSGGSLGSLVAGAESGSSSYNAYNKGTIGNRIIGADKPEDLENMSIGEIMRRQSLPKGDPNRLFAVGKYQAIPGTLKEAVGKLGLSPDSKFDKDTQERIFRDYLVGDKRPQVRDYITGKTGDVGPAVEALSNEFASFGGMNGMGKYGNGNKVSVGPQRSSAVLQTMRDTYSKNIAAGMSPADAYASAFGAGNNGASTPSIAGGSVPNRLLSLDELKQARTPIEGVTWTPGSKRTLPSQPMLQQNVRDTVTQALGEDYKVHIYSGGQEDRGSGTGSRRHNLGQAGDVYITRPDGSQIDESERAKVSQLYLAKGKGSVGLNMKGGGIHFDMMTKDKLRGNESLLWNYNNEGGYTSPALMEAARRGTLGAMPEGLKYTDEQMKARAMEKAIAQTPQMELPQINTDLLKPPTIPVTESPNQNPDSFNPGGNSSDYSGLKVSDVSTTDEWSMMLTNGSSLT